jgi:hypothetical protein
MRGTANPQYSIATILSHLLAASLDFYINIEVFVFVIVDQSRIECNVESGNESKTAQLLGCSRKIQVFRFLISSVLTTEMPIFSILDSLIFTSIRQ